MRLSVRSIVGYGAGDAANNLAFTLGTTFLLLYCTDVVGLPAATVGTMFLVVRLWDAYALAAGGYVSTPGPGAAQPHTAIIAIKAALGLVPAGRRAHAGPAGGYGRRAGAGARVTHGVDGPPRGYIEPTNPRPL
ncbi:hypothetical protein GCM10020358_44760 [Amorphoplanes nipponensis]|uniref:MFS transporter n=1 Tax=Actinoplanes nipponensis TaxID=135950 RepID=A0A919JMR8_9ACTN|nr:MFS transporter [Actinoplanes nipponensis]GIE53653.1 hypothetical protein Ani05nite_71870 [Actinoplanes nipponensis]